MNKMLIAVFDTETAADAGVHALRQLHAEGDISLYASGVIAKDAHGLVTVKAPLDGGLAGTGVGLAVGSLIGLLGGPVGLAVGAVTGTVVGAVRDYWVAGVGLDFIEQAEKMLKPGKVAVVAEIEEDWIIPVDSALEAAGGVVFRRSRSDVAEARFDHDIAAFRAELKSLELEASKATGQARAKLQAQAAATQQSLEATMQAARSHAQALAHEAEAKAASLKTQLAQSTGEAKANLSHRAKHVKAAYHDRGAKLARAWTLTKEALAVG